MRLLLLGVLLACLGGPRVARACPGCSNPNLPVSQASPSSVGKGQWLVSLSASATALEVVHESACPDIGPRCQLGDIPPYLHDQGIRTAELRARVEYGVNEWFGVQVQVPLRVTDTSITYRFLDGTPFTPPEANVHHRNETLAGAADPWITARASTELAKFRLTGRVGITLPLGSTEPDPFVAGARGEPHQHFQFGTGTINPVLVAEIARPFLERWTASAWAQAQLVPWENDYGFKAGHRLVGGVLLGSRIAGELRATAGVDVAYESAERWNGVIHQDGNLGRTDLLAGAGLGWTVASLQLSLSARTPVYQRVVGGQLTYPLVVSLSVDRVFE